MEQTPEALVAELTQRGVAVPAGHVRIGRFGDSEALSEALIALVLTGEKHGTCSLAWSWEAEGEPPPQAGDIEIVLDWHGRPAALLRISEVRIVPFDRVDAAFAASEGEADRSLAHWRTEHWRFFTEECRRIGRVAHPAMPLVCESFTLLQAIGRPPRSA
ncbi:ASCH domain-containing protein [Burkholderia glumae]|uniref:ASCH domain-containing protein n=1 Tax=Burkholderia glumae TaxID=337 RepID=UPI00039C8C2D|nr:ASCH domain-containing protein [Burkholderia glumae]MCM2494290.1 ASCH domain-containing protein [Burkholderia glumae]MCM2545237.1 ASCH domain-containing protein [Burkholderia glumae]MCM2551044.1 ASCH domain-containing protein [Burkholderia glumae]MCQ0032444.1 ASCH domain-containing protein [Burkholderia glumae]MCQ0036718.1 ASCH domain-containing protein [Burkholderia glumae]